MMPLSFNTPISTPFNVLCLGAHCDDIEIGCGGTVLKLIETHKTINLHWVVFSATEQRAQEALKSANLFLKEAANKQIIINRFRDGFLPFSSIEVKECFEQFKQTISPDLILTHYRNDLHQDHRLISDLTWNTFRNHFILEYEIPKYDGDLGIPNVFSYLDETTCRRKIQYLLDTFETQREKHWFSEDTFRSLLRIRGLESNSPSKYAEAFHCRKAIF